MTTIMNISVICMGIQGSVNLGFIARTMMNFGLRELILVDPQCVVDSEALKMACHAEAILDSLKIVSKLEDITPQFHVLAGTTGKEEITQHGPTLSPDQLGRNIASLPSRQKAAVLLGPEDHGLSHQDLKKCRWIARIPNSPAYPSMNISHAAAVLFYEIFRHCSKTDANVEGSPLPTVSQMEQFYDHFQQVLLDVGFLHSDNPERILYVIRRILSRTTLDGRELKILRGIVRQTHWALQQARMKFRK